MNFSGKFRALITGATALISVIALAPSLEASAVLTGLTEFSTDASGNFSGGQLWNTVNGDGANNLYIADGGPAGAFLNSGDGASTAPSINLQIGTNAFAIFGEPGLAISSYGLNLFFDGSNAAGISVFAPVRSGPAIPAFSANSGTSTGGNLPHLNRVSGAGTLSFQAPWAKRYPDRLFLGAARCRGSQQSRPCRRIK